MLHEILLSLSGVKSSIWDQASSSINDQEPNLGQYVSRSERLMLAELAHLAEIHLKLKEDTTQISSLHQLPVCRAIGAAIRRVYLSRFIEQVEDVETSILRKDSDYVGGYQIVPLSTIVTNFAPWTRRLDWLLKMTSYILNSPNSPPGTRCTGAQILNLLERETHTGYSDVREMAFALLVVGQKVWLQLVTSWVLSGQLPSHGVEDFMIRRPPEDDPFQQHLLDHNLAPKLMTPNTADSILAIGNAHNEISSQFTSNDSTPLNKGLSTELLPLHLAYLKSLEYPLDPVSLENCMSKIDESISTNALSKLLPLQKILEMLLVTQRYLLLERGEFATVLIGNVDDRVAARQKERLSTKSVRKLGRLEEMSMKAPELRSILAKTWSDIATVQGDLETESEVFATAKRLLKLQNVDQNGDAHHQLHNILASLLPNPSVLTFEVPRNSPFNIFLDHTTIERYARTNAYLLSIRRAEIRLSSLWTLSGHRRCHPSPLAPPLSATQFGKRALKQRRIRESKRASNTRACWSSVSKALFVLKEFDAYLHGEVISSSWKHFRVWLLGTEQSHASMLHSTTTSRPAISSSTPPMNDSRTGPSVNPDHSGQGARSDPRTIARAHKAYVSALQAALLLDYPEFLKVLRSLCQLIDHLVALFVRIQSVWTGLDLQEDDGVLDAFNNYVQDEQDIYVELSRSRIELEELLVRFIENIKRIEKEKSMDDLASGFVRVGVNRNQDGGFVPWRARTLDRLIMKLDFLRKEKEKDSTDNDDDKFVGVEE